MIPLGENEESGGLAMKRMVCFALALLLGLSMCSGALAEKTAMKFYGLILEYPFSQGQVDRMAEKLADKYDIEQIPVDWGNLDTVIRTGIASGSPCDVYCYWPQAMATFVDAGQALDLTPYLEANGGEWKNSFVPAQLDTGLFDGKYYAVPLDGLYQMAMINTQIFKDAGVEVKETWTWDEFKDACEKIKAIGKHPFALGNQGLDWVWKNVLASRFISEGRYDQFLSYDIAKDDEALSYLLDLFKELNDKGYWYPGQGGVNIQRDEARASFVKGDTAILFEMSSLFAGIQAECDFEIAPVCWPRAGEVTVNMGGTDGYFIPANVKNPDAAVELLKVLLDKESMAMMVPDAMPAGAGIEISDPTLSKLVELSQYMQSTSPANPELTTFLKTSFVADYVLGTSGKEDLLDEYETLRLAAKG